MHRRDLYGLPLGGPYGHRDEERQDRGGDAAGKGGGVEVYEPHFTFQGFRYVAVEGFPGTPTLDAITGIAVYSDLPRAGTFETSNALVNRLQQNIVWGQRGNFIDVPTDCPQRDERLGWTGDAQVFAPTAAFNMDVSGFFAKWLADRDNPLTARVAVNHVWLRHFGQAIVPSVFDFGRNGRAPSHPALLDWLAAEFMEPWPGRNA